LEPRDAPVRHAVAAADEDEPAHLLAVVGKAEIGRHERRRADRITALDEAAVAPPARAVALRAGEAPHDGAALDRQRVGLPPDRVERRLAEHLLAHGDRVAL